MTRYSVDVYAKESWESIALFSDAVCFSAMVDFCVSQFANGNSLTLPAKDIAIIDLSTGEVIWDWGDECQTDSEPWDDEPMNIDDDCGFDPYLGCYTDDC